jgi:hypothetical protein
VVAVHKKWSEEKENMLLCVLCVMLSMEKLAVVVSMSL